MALSDDWVITSVKEDLWTWARPRWKSFIRAMFAYIRNNPGASLSAINTYAGTLPVVLEGITNQTVLSRWIAGMSFGGNTPTSAQVVALVRACTNDEALQLLDPAVDGMAMPDAATLYHRKILGIVGKLDGVADRSQVFTREPVHNMISSEVVSGTVDGVFRTLTRTYSYDFAAPAWTPTISPWVLT